MKRSIALVLILIMVAALCGCHREEPVTEDYSGTFRVGYGRADITPLTSVPLAGYGNTEQRMSETILDLQYATCLAITDENDKTVLLIALDQQRASDITVNAVRPLISAETGIPQDYIMISGSHTHSGPDLHATSNEAIINYIPYLNEQICQAARDALADQKPATIEAGSIETERMNFIRHYVYTDENGQDHYFGDSFGTTVITDTTRHVSEVDPTMFVVRITQSDGEEIVMVNWRAHPSGTGYKGGPLRYVSSDYVGSFRDALENQIGCDFIYFNGACGNINSSSRIPGEAKANSNNERGCLLADYAMECLNNNMEPIDTGDVQIIQKDLNMEINHDMDHMVAQARSVQTVFKLEGYDAAKLAGAPYGIRTAYMAGAIISNSNRPENMDVELNALAIGDQLGFVTFPGELFDDLGEYVEANSPFEYTMVLCYANGMRGYIPTAATYEYTSYETDCCWFKPGCGEEIQEELLTLIESLEG